MAFNSTVAQNIAWIYVGAFSRPPVPSTSAAYNDPDGLAWWTDRFLTDEEGNPYYNDYVAIGESFAASAEFEMKYGALTDNQYITQLYQNMLGRDPDPAGLQYWVDRLEAGDSRGEILAEFGFSDENRAAEINQGHAASFNSYIVALANGTEDSWLANNPTLDPAWIPEGDYTLTLGPDNLIGGSGDDTFVAPVQQAFLGISNTLETGDQINGGGGVDVLRADLITTSTAAIPAGPAISPITNDVEQVYLRAQSINTDLAVNLSTIDAERMYGVEQWWSDNSRSSIQIEDIRSMPEATTFGMVETDPAPGGLGGIVAAGAGAGLYAYFDPAQVSDDRLKPTDSSLTLTLVDNGGGAELENFPLSGVAFRLDGVQYIAPVDLEGDATYTKLTADLNAYFATEPALADLVAVLNADNTITISDPNGGTFEAVGWTWVGNIVPAAGDLAWDQTVGAPIPVEMPIETGVVLDFVGRSSRGGSLDIGSMADGGVNVFNVEVDRDSWLTQMASRSDFGGGGLLNQLGIDTGLPPIGVAGYERHLETVNLASTGADGDLTVGLTGYEMATFTLSGLLFEFDPNLNCQNDPRVFNGLIDVQTVDGREFAGELNLGITLTEDAVRRYLDDATGEVEFNYWGSNQNDLFSFGLDEVLTGDPDFAMNVDMAGGDDYLSLFGFGGANGDITATNISVDGGEGSNKIAVNSSFGVDDATTFRSFANFATYEVQGDNDTTHDFTTMPGVETVVIATLEDNDDTTLIDLEDGTGVVISGKFQTCNDSNADQLFGDIAIQGADGEVLDITLENTARIDGQLIIDEIDVEDESVGNESAVTTVNLTSEGSRDTSNIVRDFDGERVTTLNLLGTQDLSILVDEMALLPVSGGNTPALTIDGSDLTGDLTLALNADMLRRNNLDRVTGTDGSNDLLALFNAGNDLSTTIVGFETIQFGWTANSFLDGVFDTGSENSQTAASITFNAANATGTDTFVIGLPGAGNALTLNNLQDGVNVVLGDESGENVLFDALNTLNAASGGVLNLRMSDVLDSITVSTTNINGFQTVNLDVASTVPFVLNPGDLSPDREFDLDFDADVTRLVVTGGEEGGSVTLDDLEASLSYIDFSGYEGGVTASLVDVPGDNTNTTIVVGNTGMFEFDENRATLTTDMVITYVFTSDVLDDTYHWEIDEFQAFNAGGGSLSNLSILDLRALGVSSLAEVVISDVVIPGQTTITSNTGLDFEIALIGVLAADLSNENFMFA